MRQPSDDEINEQEKRALNIGDRKGTLFRGMTYEQGVADTIRWLMRGDEKPLSDNEAGEYDE